MYDVVVIGGGVVGTLILRELSKYHLRCAILEKEDDVSTGASRANSGIIHAGYDCVPGTLKAKLNVQGNALMYPLCAELNVPYKKTGSLVVATSEQLEQLKILYDRGIVNGVDVEILERDTICKIEPNVADEVNVALFAKEAGIVSPYKLTIKAGEQAVLNGCEVKLSTEVKAIAKTTDGYRLTTNKGDIFSKVVINSAGAYAADINNMLNDEIFHPEFRRGEYFLLDKTESKNINTVLFPLPDENGKGVLVSPTADGNVIYGPTSTLCDREDVITTAEGLDIIKKQISKSYKAANYRKIIRLYSGMRCAVGDDFVIKNSTKNYGYIMLLGICSPALTSSPSIAKMVVEELVSQFLVLNRKESYLPLPKSIKVNGLAKEEINELIAKDSRYGRVVCRCETVSEGEIIDAIHSLIPATTVDAVKRRTRAGMGRCQGGFCMPNILRILSRELNIPITEVKKGGEGTEIANGDLAEVNYEL